MDWKLLCALLFLAAVVPSNALAQSGYTIDASVTQSDLARTAEATHSRITVSQPTAAVTENVTVTITLLDAAEKPLADRDIIVSWQKGDAVIGQVKGKTDARGTYQTVITTDEPQRLTIVAYDAALYPPLQLLQTASVTFEEPTLSTSDTQDSGGQSWFQLFAAFVRGLFR